MTAQRRERVRRAKKKKKKPGYISNFANAFRNWMKFLVMSQLFFPDFLLLLFVSLLLWIRPSDCWMDDIIGMEFQYNSLPVHFLNDDK